ncbi:nucleotide kinase domain-containing protein [Stenotrophomonas sp.]|uniref:nucleotide kinase domain-containing protein n=1 Tax=Stenotrophomonas sp. TaxID=69392 RepID=UPI0028ABC559|nr:nucleotide kinase domain-containing protein [Stenotrophomonas sp.]
MTVGISKSGQSPEGDSMAVSTQILGPSHLLPIKVTPVFDSYWRFAVERQNVFYNRLKGRPSPWTPDPVISVHKFTNAYRASDRVSQYLIRHVIYREDLPSSSAEVFFRTLLFKLFNKIETWKLLEHAFGEITFKNYKFEHYDNVLSQAMRAGGRIYSAAYIMPPGGSAFGHAAKHQNHLRLLERMMADDLAGKLERQKKMQTAFELLRSYPTIGDFLAYQFVTDINYSEITDFSEMDFVVPGPGARDGLRKCFADSAGLNEAELIRLVADNQEREFERIGIDFQSLWGRRLQLIDCQNLFCEVDKYARVAHPDVAGISGRTRIKQKFSPTGPIDMPWYPPKWGINEKVKVDLSNSVSAMQEEKLRQRAIAQSNFNLGG